MIRYAIGGSLVIVLATSSYFLGKSVKENDIVAEYQKSYISQYETYRETERRLKTKVSNMEREHYKELLDAEENIDELLDNVSRGSKRLYVKAKCPKGTRLPEDGNTTSMGDESRKAKLDKDVARRLIRLTKRGDRAIRKLNACQQYISENIKAINGVDK